MLTNLKPRQLFLSCLGEQFRSFLSMCPLEPMILFAFVNIFHGTPGIFFGPCVDFFDNSLIFLVIGRINRRYRPFAKQRESGFFKQSIWTNGGCFTTWASFSHFTNPPSSGRIYTALFPKYFIPDVTECLIGGSFFCYFKHKIVNPITLENHKASNEQSVSKGLIFFFSSAKGGTGIYRAQKRFKVRGTLDPSWSLISSSQISGSHFPPRHFKPTLWKIN